MHTIDGVGVDAAQSSDAIRSFTMTRISSPLSLPPNSRVPYSVSALLDTKYIDNAHYQ